MARSHSPARRLWQPRCVVTRDEEHAVLLNRVRRLDESYLDLDLLDERARAVLGYVRQDELVIR